MIPGSVRKGFEIRAMQPGDWPAVKAIYLEGIATGLATFETETPSWEAWSESHLDAGRIVVDSEGAILGWAALSPVSKRKVYTGVAEVSVYVSANHRQMGIGRALLEQLITEAERDGIWTLQAVVFPENVGTIALHRRCGFREVGRRERIGKLNGVWRDTLLFERRSHVIH
jgi:L-amino acid N-acyltransferase YncA